jgi:hypothetical protein
LEDLEMAASKDFVIVHTVSEKRTIQGDVVCIKKAENWSLKKYVGNDEIVVIPDGIETISPRAFENCESIRSIVISESVKTIGCAAFYKCINLESVRIPSSVKKLGSSAFAECEKLRAVVFEGEVPWYNCAPLVFLKCPNLIIYASKDNYIKRYAKNNKISFVAI